MSCNPLSAHSSAGLEQEASILFVAGSNPAGRTTEKLSRIGLKWRPVQNALKRTLINAGNQHG